MLVISRHRDESIKIGDDIQLTVIDIRGDKVRLGIDAPVHVPVHRHEVYMAIKQHGQTTDPQGEFPAGLWFRAACSGLWYRDRRAAGAVSTVMLDGVPFSAPADTESAA